MNCTVYARKAKAALSGHYLRAFRISMLYQSIRILFGLLAFACVYYLDTAYIHIVLPAMEFAILALSLWVVGSVRMGGQAWRIRCAQGREPSFLQFLYWLRRGRGLRGSVLHSILLARKAGWTGLLCAPAAAAIAALQKQPYTTLPGVLPVLTNVLSAAGLLTAFICAQLLAQRYALAGILLARNPKLKIHEAIRCSTHIMDGYCAKLLTFKLSFLPALSLCAAILPAVRIIPYYQQSVTCYLLDVLKRTEHQLSERVNRTDANLTAESANAD